MTGMILLSANGKYATQDGKVDWGPESDKAWVRENITGKIVLVGFDTFDTISKYPKLLALAKQWFVPSYNRLYGYKNVARLDPLDTDISALNIDINFGGPHTLAKYPPDKLIVHIAPVDLVDGSLEFPKSIFDKYNFAQRVGKPEYLEEIYVKK